MTQENEFVRRYLHIRHYIVNDINCLLDADKEYESYIGCGIYVLVVSSGIDFLGSLIVASQNPNRSRSVGLKGISKEGYIYYLKNFMAKVNPIYGKHKIAEFIYDIIRCGQTHEAIAKGGVILGKQAENKYHLKRISQIDRTFFNAKIFATDFLESLDHFEELLETEDSRNAMEVVFNENFVLTTSNFDRYLSAFDNESVNDEELNIILEGGSSFPIYEYCFRQGIIDYYR